MSSSKSGRQAEKVDPSVFLRALESEDLDRIHRWHNDKELYKTLVGSFRYVSRATVEEWLKKRQQPSAEQVSLAICKSEGEHIGNIYLHEIDWIARRAEISLFIGDAQNRGKGYGYSAIRSMLEYAFRELNLARVVLHVLADNEAAVHVYEKCGFKVEGRLPCHVYKQGRLKDVLIMGVCASELPQG